MAKNELYIIDFLSLKIEKMLTIGNWSQTELKKLKSVSLWYVIIQQVNTLWVTSKVLDIFRHNNDNMIFYILLKKDAKICCY